MTGIRLARRTAGSTGMGVGRDEEGKGTIGISGMGMGVAACGKWGMARRSGTHPEQTTDWSLVPGSDHGFPRSLHHPGSSEDGYICPFVSCGLILAFG